MTVAISSKLASRLRKLYKEGGLRKALGSSSRFFLRKAIPETYKSVDSTKILNSNGLQETSGTRCWELPKEPGSERLFKSDTGDPFNGSSNPDRLLLNYQYSYRTDFVFEIDHVRLLGPSGVGITRHGEAIEDTVNLPGHYRLEKAITQAFNRYPACAYLTVNTPIRSIGPPEISLDLACSLYSGWNNYYHWLLEHLPKLRAVEYYTSQSGNRPTLIIPNDPPTFVLESLRMAGIDPANCVQWDPSGVDVDTLVVPTYPEANPDTLSWLRSTFRENIETDDRSELPSRIYVSRQQVERRAITNEAEFLNVIEEYGFERVFAENLSFAEQVELFSNAEAVIGPHGAGLTNIIWADDIPVFEIHNDDIRDHYYVLANNLGHDYVPIKGSSTHPAVLNSNLEVDVTAVDQTLSNIFE